ncbi:MAG: sigma-70 family RNA polymerase sigma factor [Myxococcales bacterium]|nr:sigma-70 family RNA polymerase sigma factor [Myxococcales bacterium]
MILGALLRFVRPAASDTLDFATLYTRHAGLVHRRVRRFFPAEDSEEHVHAIFLRALEKQATWRGEASPTTWLYQLATRYCLNRLRDRARQREALAINAELPWLLPAEAPDAAARVFLEELWATLDEETTLMATYYFVDGMTHEEIARVTGVSRRTVGNRLEALQATARQAAGEASP